MQFGVFGQGFSVGKVMVWGLLVAVGGCAGGVVRYAGVVTATEGDCGLGFVAGRATASLVVRGEEVAFAPTDGVTVLPGRVSGAGHVVAGSSVVGADKKPFAQVFEGERVGDAVRGVFATPRCRATVALTRG